MTKSDTNHGGGRAMGRVESLAMRLSCRIWGHVWIDLTGDVEGKQCMRCYTAEDVDWYGENPDWWQEDQNQQTAQ